MTTLSLPAQRRSNSLILIILAVCVLAGLLWFTAPDTITNSHAEKHGEDARAVRCALHDRGFFDSYQDEKSGRWHLLVRLADGRIGDHVCVQEDDLWFEVTSFVLGSLTAALAYVCKRAHRKNLHVPWAEAETKYGH